MKLTVLKLAIAILIVSTWRSPAASIMADVGESGQITVRTRKGGWGDGTDREGVIGEFTVTKKNPDGTTMTVAQLEKSLGQDHLNWFQKVIETVPDPPPETKDANGDPVKPPFIDPPKGGYQGEPDDDVSWLWSEPVELATATVGSTLRYFDAPDNDVDKATFVTFLISDYGNTRYSVFTGGFTWTEEKDPNTGLTKITSLEDDAVFLPEYEKEIRDEFGYSYVPDTGSFWSFPIGIVAVLGSRRYLCTRRPLGTAV